MSERTKKYRSGPLRVYLECFGCQMNASDTEFIGSLFEEEGAAVTQDPSDSDVILVNTCSVREKAETRAVGRLNDLSRHGAVLVACGCMAQRLGEELFDMVPGLDIVAGPDCYRALPKAVESARNEGLRSSLTREDAGADYPGAPGASSSPSRFLTITRGCENFCTYCIVPYVRGRVRSRAPESILDDIRSLKRAGAKAVTLLGQNVMAWNCGGEGFTGLLSRVVEETSIERIRFLTTHPRDLDAGIFRLMAESDRVCPHLHLPVQSGSDRILEAMNRGYTRDRFLSAVEEARRVIPELAVSTDVIVGFPGETGDDFERTLDVVRKVRFDSAFTFKYSPRRGTAAFELEDDVPIGEKKRRLRVLNGEILRIRREILESHLGTRQEILLDGKVQKGEYQFLKGRTPHFRNVLVKEEGLQVGCMAEVILNDINNFTYSGEVISRRWPACGS